MRIGLVVVLSFIINLFLYGEIQASAQNAIEISPLSPVMNIYAFHYNHLLTDKDEMMIGPTYMRIKYDFGHTDAGGLILGYRKYFYKKAHIEYQIWPIYDNFYESVEDKRYKSFDIWNEFRIGYLFDFKVLNKDLYVNVQWPFGFGLYASNKPESFKKMEKEGDNRFFYFPPLIFTGIRF